MILITGATGHFGSTAIDFLLKKIPAGRIAAFVRNESKAGPIKKQGVEIRTGDYEDYTSLLNAMQGVEKVLLVSGNDIPNRQKHHEQVVNAAREAGVKHIVYTSFVRKNETETSPLGILGLAHVETDKYIRASGIPYTIMLNALYADVLPMFFGDKVLETGIYLPAGDGKVSYATRQDMAEAAANILSGEGHGNREYFIANTVNYTLYDAAAILSGITGKEVAYLNPGKEEFTAALSAAGVPEEAVAATVSFCEAIRQGEFETRHTDLPMLLGREPASLEDFLKATYKR